MTPLALAADLEAKHKALVEARTEKRPTRTNIGASEAGILRSLGYRKDEPDENYCDLIDFFNAVDGAYK